MSTRLKQSSWAVILLLGMAILVCAISCGPHRKDEMAGAGRGSVCKHSPNPV